MIRELWSTEDEEHCQRMLRAVEGEDLASLLFAIEGADEDRQRAARGWFSRLAERCVLLAEEKRYRTSARILGRVLVEEMSFRGDAQNYRAPCNAHLSEVVVRRRGLPILLSSLWCIVGEEAGMDCQGVALPGHFIARIDGVLVDPFNEGRVLDRDACALLVRRIAGQEVPWEDRWLEGVDYHHLAERVLRNLVASYLDEGDACRIYRTFRQLTALCPTDPECLLNRGRMASMFSLHREALALFEKAEDLASCAHLQSEAREAREALAREPHLVN